MPKLTYSIIENRQIDDEKYWNMYEYTSIVCATMTSSQANKSLFRSGRVFTWNTVFRYELPKATKKKNMIE